MLLSLLLLLLLCFCPETSLHRLVFLFVVRFVFMFVVTLDFLLICVGGSLPLSPTRMIITWVNVQYYTIRFHHHLNMEEASFAFLFETKRSQASHDIDIDGKCSSAKV